MAIENDDLLYVYDTSEGEGKKIKYETLKSGGSGTGEFGYWNRTGTTLSPVNAGDQVIVGGNPNQGGAVGSRLWSDGRVQACRDQDSAEVISVFKEGETSAKAAFYGSGTLAIGGTLPSAPNISLNANGSARFTDRITGDEDCVITKRLWAGNGAVSNSTEIGLSAFGKFADDGGQNAAVYAKQFDSNGNLYLGADRNNNRVFEVKEDGTTKIIGTGTSAAPNITLNANGVGEFKGNVHIGNATADGDGVSARAFGALYIRQDGATNNALSIYNGGQDNTAIKASISNDGSATFAGGFFTISGSGNTVANSGSGATFEARKQKGVGPNTDDAFLVRDVDLNEVAAIRHDGSATFAGSITASDTIYTTEGNFIAEGPYAYFSADRDTAESNGLVLFVGKTKGVEKFKVTTDGSATFAGSITGNSWNGTSGTGTGYFLASTGGVFARRGSSAANTDLLFGGWKEDKLKFLVNAGGNAYIGDELTPNTGAGATISLLSNGSATFAGSVSSADRFSVNASDSNQRAYQTKLPNTNKTAFLVQANGRVKIGGDIDGGADGNVTLNTDGSASFSEQLIQGTFASNNNGSRLKNGQLALGRLDQADTTAFIYGKRYTTGQPEKETFKITVDGSATFAGKVTSASTQASDPGTTLVTKDYVDANAGGGGGGSGLGTVGSIAMLAWAPDGVNPDAVIPGDTRSGNLYYSYVDGTIGVGAPIVTGTWEALGFAFGESPNGPKNVTLWRRIS